MNIVSLKRPPSNLAAELRALADQAEAGKVTDAVVAYVSNDERGFIYASSLSECLVMATLLKQNCIDRMRA